MILVMRFMDLIVFNFEVLLLLLVLMLNMKIIVFY